MWLNEITGKLRIISRMRPLVHLQSSAVKVLSHYRSISVLGCTCNKYMSSSVNLFVCRAKGRTRCVWTTRWIVSFGAKVVRLLDCKAPAIPFETPLRPRRLMIKVGMESKLLSLRFGLKHRTSGFGYFSSRRRRIGETYASNFIIAMISINNNKYFHYISSMITMNL